MSGSVICTYEAVTEKLSQTFHCKGQTSLHFSNVCLAWYDLCSLPEPDDEENVDEEPSAKPSDPQGPEAAELPLAAVEHQVDVLLEEWNKGADMLFSIHPTDGSLLVWHVDWLDEYHPGMFRQAQVHYVLIVLMRYY